MAVLPLVIAPDERLNTPSKPVDEITDEVKKLCDDMLETMYANQGIGLAAVQVGVHKRVIVVDVEWGSSRYEGDEKDEQKGNPIILINPEIVEESDDLSSYNEGCLSFPDQYSEVERPADIEVKYLNRHSEEKRLKANGLLATCIQHEIDHINGVVFVDHISKLKREMIIRKLKKAKKLGTISVESQPVSTS
ncbi:MAG: peptide deformylase [Rickettsiales bacterium]|nr:peptide deformylase [Rickettsiales bacterium]